MACLGSPNRHSGQSSRSEVVDGSGTTQSADKLSLTDTDWLLLLPPTPLRTHSECIRERKYNRINENTKTDLARASGGV